MGGCLSNRVTRKKLEKEDSQESFEDSEISVDGMPMLPGLAGTQTKDMAISELVLNFSSDKKILCPSNLFAGSSGGSTEATSTIFGRGSTRESAVSSWEYASFNTTLPPTAATQVTSQLYLGSFEDAKNEEELRNNEITHIISVIGPKHLISGIKHMNTPMNDYGRSDLQQILKKLWPFVQESQEPGKALFVHCMSGQNRSATVVIAILMRSQGQTLKEAFRMVKQKRPVVQINCVYAKQLSKMEQELYGRTSMPENWMEIDSVNIETGSVYFSGENLTTTLTTSRRTTHNTGRSIVKKNSGTRRSSKVLKLNPNLRSSKNKNHNSVIC